jgi:hypothetical protein
MNALAVRRQIVRAKQRQIAKEPPPANWSLHHAVAGMFEEAAEKGRALSEQRREAERRRRRPTLLSLTRAA